MAYLERGTITTIEFKLRDWHRAVQQARDHRLGADYAYICMPPRRFTDKMRSKLIHEGVGLMFFNDKGNWPFDTVLDAPRSEEALEVIRADLISRIESPRRDNA